jgi:ankyrin repeat protein
MDPLILNSTWVDSSDEAIKALIDSCEDLDMKDPDGVSPLIFAIRNKKLVLIDYLKCKGANLNIITNLGNSALTEAAIIGNLEIFKYLIDSGANVNSASILDGFSGTTALHQAAKLNLEYFVFLLLNNGANKHITDEDGKTPSEVAASDHIIDLIGN